MEQEDQREQRAYANLNHKMKQISLEEKNRRSQVADYFREFGKIKKRENVARFSLLFCFVLFLTEQFLDVWEEMTVEARSDFHGIFPYIQINIWLLFN